MIKVPLDHLVKKVHLVHQGYQVLMDLRVKLGLMEALGFLGHKVLLGILDRMVLLDLQEKRVMLG